MLSSQAGSIRGVLFLVAAVTWSSTSVPAATTVFRHAGAVSPQDPNQGWGITPGDITSPGVLGQNSAALEVGPVPADPIGARAAWGINDRSAGSSTRLRYERVPAPTDVAAGSTQGWALRSVLRVAVEGDVSPGSIDAVDAAIIVEYGEGPGGNRYGLEFGAEANGDAIVRLLGDGRQHVAPGTGYHHYELAFDPAGGLAVLLVDGVRALDGYAGIVAGAVAARVNFGSGSSSGTGRGHYALVEWGTGAQACANGLDDDGDGLVDYLPAGGDPGCSEALDPSESSPALGCDDAFDNDADGVVDLADPECEAPATGTEADPDLDDDGLTDGEEINLHGTDPLDPDTDDDGLLDGDEVDLYGSNPLSRDTDGDTVEDADEVHLTQTDPAGADLFREQVWIADPVAAAILRVDVVTGDRSILSGPGVGSGAALVAPYGLAPQPGDPLLFWVADYVGNCVYQVSHGTGNRLPVSGGCTGSGRVPANPVGVTRRADGMLFYTDFGLDAVFSAIQPSWFRNVVSAASAPAGPVGTGIAFQEPRDILVEPSGTLLVTDPSLDALVRIDPTTGNRTVLSGPSAGSGPVLVDPFAIDYDPSGRLWLAAGSVLWRVNPVTGHRVQVSGPGLGSGPPFQQALGLAFDPQGRALVSDNGPRQVLRVDPLTGDRELITGGGRGGGPAFGGVRELLHRPALDQDADGLTDEREVNAHGTDPMASDSDADGLADLFELTNGFDPLVAGDEALDPDDDGLDNLGEQAAGSDPFDPDTDDDGLSDGDEVLEHGSSPSKSDTDADGIDDIDEVLQTGTHPGQADPFREQIRVADPVADTIVRVDVASGDRSILSGPGVGQGPALPGPYGLESDLGGDFWVADFSSGLIVRVDPATGDRSIVTGPSLGTGTILTDPVGVAREADGRLAVTDFGLDAVVRVDPSTGNRVVVSDAVLPGGGSVGTGVDPPDMRDIEVEANGSLLVVDFSLDALLRIDPATGNRTVLSGPAAGAGPPLVNPFALELDGTGDPWVATLTALHRVDAATGNRVVLSGPGVGQGPPFQSALGLAFDGQGRPLVADDGRKQVMRVDPVTGRREVISGGSVGSGPAFAALRELVHTPALDRDGDGVSDLFEFENGLDPLVGGDGVMDQDADGLDNVAEQAAGTDPFDSDSDDDGLSDGLEIDVHATDPLDADTDEDGLSDGAEIGVHGTNPLAADMDADGLSDGFEIAHGFDPFSPGEQHQDPDLDGLDNLAEQRAGTHPGLADTDGDGLSDGSETARVRLYGFRAQRIITTGALFPESVHAADLDGDGDLDALSASSGDQTIAWHENRDGAGSFGPRLIITPQAPGARWVDSADLNGDGRLDILTLTNAGIGWHPNLGGEEMFGPRRALASPGSIPSVVPADLDDDGDIDVLSASLGDHSIAWHENLDGGGDLGVRHVIASGLAGPIAVFPADLDGDGDLDVLSSDLDDTIAWQENMGSGLFGPRQIFTTSANFASPIFAADLDGDTDADVLWASGQDNTIAWQENLDGEGLFGPPQLITATPSAPTSIVPADLDGDGDLDIVSGTNVDMAWSENLGAAMFGPRRVVTTGAAPHVSNLAADLDGDDSLDILSAVYDSKVAWYPNRATGPLDADTDGDGLLDGFEDDHGFDPLTPGQQSQDPDADGLDNLAEQAAGTDPRDADTDNDGSLDGADCAPLDGAAFAPPVAVTGMVAEAIPGGHRFTWDGQAAGAGAGVVYDIFTGSPAALAPEGGFSMGICLVEDLPVTLLDVPGAGPAPGEALYFMIRAQNACATGTYGTPNRDTTSASSAVPCL